MSEEDGSATPLAEDPDEAFATWHYLEFGFRPRPAGPEREFPTLTVESLRSAWEHGRQFERKLITERNRRAIREARKEIEGGRKDTKRTD